MATTRTGNGGLKHPSWDWKIKTVQVIYLQEGLGQYTRAG